MKKNKLKNLKLFWNMVYFTVKVSGIVIWKFMTLAFLFSGFVYLYIERKAPALSVKHMAHWRSDTFSHFHVYHNGWDPKKSEKTGITWS